MTVLLRSRCLIRGILSSNDDNECKEGGPGAACVITHSPSAATLADWEDDDSQINVATTVENNEISGDNPAPKSGDGNPLRLPPIIDDSTELDHARRREIAKSHGFVYDEVGGVKSILNALTHHERGFLADDNMPLRHYRAEKGNLNEAIRKIKSTLKWREEFCVEDIKRCFDKEKSAGQSPERRKELDQLADVIAHENETGKIYCRGYDRQGRAILYLTPGKENSTDEMNNMRHLVYHLERAIACTRRKSGREKVCIVIGYQGFRLANAPPLSTVKHTLTILQGHYPERMHRAYICDPPLMFRSFWGIIRHFVDPATLEKVAFCAGRDGKTLLDRDFDTSSTERQAGGTNRELREFNSREFLFDTPFHCTFDEEGM